MKWLVTLGASLHAVVTILMTSSLAGGRLLEKRNKATRPSNRSIEQSQRTKRNRRCAACICGTAGTGCSSEHQDFQNRTSEQNIRTDHLASPAGLRDGIRPPA